MAKVADHSHVSNGDGGLREVAEGTVNAAAFPDLETAITFATDEGYHRVHAPAGEGDGPNGEYVYTPGTDLDLGVRDLILTGDGRPDNQSEGTILKVGDGAASDYDALLRVTTGGVVRDLAIDGNKSNQTDGGDNLNQAGILIQNNGRVENVDIFDCQYAPWRMQGADGARVIDVTGRNCGMGPHYRETTLGNGEDVRIVRPRVRGCGGSSASLGDGLIIGDKAQDVDVDSPSVEARSNTADAILIEASDEVRVNGGQTRSGEVRTLLSTNVEIRGLTVHDGRVKLSNPYCHMTGGMVVDAPAEAILMDGIVNTATLHGVNIENAGDEAVKVRGAQRGASLDIHVHGADANGNGAPCVLLENDGSNDCKDVRVTGFFDGENNASHAVEGADASQTALLDGAVIRRMATGEATGSGVTVGDTL